MFRTGCFQCGIFLPYNNFVSASYNCIYGLGIKHIQIKALIEKIYYCISHCVTII